MSPNNMRARSNKQHCLEINAFFLAKCSLFALLNQYIGTDKIDPMILWALSNLVFVPLKQLVDYRLLFFG